MRKFCLIFLCLYSWTTLVAQNKGHQISIQIKNYEQPYLYLANHFGDSQYIVDSTQINQEGLYIFQGANSLSPGLYLVVMAPENNFFQLLIDTEQHFSISTIKETPAQSMQISGSPMNTEYYNYLNFMGLQSVRQRAYLQAANEAEENNDLEMNNSMADSLDRVRLEIEEYGVEMQKEHQDNFLGKLTKANSTVDVPGLEENDTLDFEGWAYIKSHWFDFIDLGDPRFLRTPVMFDKIEYYLEHIITPLPDSIITSLDLILEKVKPAPESFQYYLSYFLHKYEHSNIIVMDAVFDHLGEKYLKGNPPAWMEQDEIDRILEKHERQKPLLIGKPAPDLNLQIIDVKKTLKRKKKKKAEKRFAQKGEFNLKSIGAEFTILFIYNPDCGHCKKSLPHLKEFHEKWKPKGVEVVALCSCQAKEIHKCAQLIKDLESNAWLNAIDPFNKSRHKQLYDVRTTPQLYILDKGGEIFMKKLDAKELDSFLEEVW